MIFQVYSFWFFILLSRLLMLYVRCYSIGGGGHTLSILVLIYDVAQKRGFGSRYYLVMWDALPLGRFRWDEQVFVLVRYDLIALSVSQRGNSLDTEPLIRLVPFIHTSWISLSYLPYLQCCDMLCSRPSVQSNYGQSFQFCSFDTAFSCNALIINLSSLTASVFPRNLRITLAYRHAR